MKLLFILAVAFSSYAQIPLWPNGAPGAQGTSESDIPAITPFPIKGEAAVPAVIVFPGGGYQHLASTYEGNDIARWLNERGVAGFVLRYRLGPKYHHPIEMEDAQRAIRWVRAHAAEYHIDSHKLGVWGFSAGGHLAATVGTHYDQGRPEDADVVNRQSSRPDFLVLAYPVISMEDPYVHKGSRKNLLGDNPSEELVRQLSNDRQVNEDTPPTFLFQTSDDPVVPAQNSVLFYLALRKNNVSVEMHIFEHGRHGVGLALDNPQLSVWPALLETWMKAHAYLPVSR